MDHRARKAKRSSAPRDTPRRRITRRALLPQEELFCVEYIAHRFNGCAAAIAAGYAEACARQTASRLLTRANIQDRIAGLIDAGLKKAHRTAADVLAEMCTIGFSDIADFVTWDENGECTFTDASKIDPQIRRACESIHTADTQFGRRISIKMHDKMTALGLLAKHHKLVVEHVSHENPDGSALTGALLLLPDNGHTSPAIKPLAVQDTPDGDARVPARTSKA